jgi:protoporphyrinogen oxidase
LGVDVRTGEGVTAIRADADGVTAVELGESAALETDAVVFCGQLPALANLVPTVHHDVRWTATGGLGVLCVILELRAPISAVYWTNICDRQMPFGGLIEHTNLVPAADYGRHVVYLSRYFTHDESIAAADPDEEAARWVDALEDRFATFSRDDVLGLHRFRADYAAPLVRVGQASRLAPIRSHIPGLYVATTAQIYPHDRGMSEGVRLGREAAAAVLEDRATARSRS